MKIIFLNLNIQHNELVIKRIVKVCININEYLITDCQALNHVHFLNASVDKTGSYTGLSRLDPMIHYCAIHCRRHTHTF